MADASGSQALQTKATGRRVRISVFGDNAGTGRGGQRKIGRRTVEGKKFNRRNKKKRQEEAKRKAEEEAKSRTPAVKPPGKSVDLDIFGNNAEDDAGDSGDDGGDGGGGDGGDDDSDAGDDGGAS